MSSNAHPLASFGLPIPERLLRNAPAIKVLIVDGSRGDAERTWAELSRAGVANECRSVAGSDDLQSALLSFSPDVVLCELLFPDFDGFAVEQVVHKLRPDTPLIFLSHAGGDDVAARVSTTGAVDYIPKASLFRLPGAVRQAVWEAQESQRLRKSIGNSTVRSRQQRERLEALWRIVNDPNKQGELLTAVVTEAVMRLSRELSYFGMLGHIEGPEFVIDVVLGELGPEHGAARRLLRVGMRGPVADVIHLRDVAAGRTHSWDDIDAFSDPPAYSRAAGLRSQITTQFLAGETTYMLTIGSLVSPSATPFSTEDYAYVEVVGSILARQLELHHHEAALRDAAMQNEQHRRRLEAIYRVLANPTLRGQEILTAMLTEASKAIRPGQTFESMLGHIEGSHFVIDAGSVGHGPSGGGALAGLLPVGARVDLSDTLSVRNLTAGRTQSWIDCQGVPDLPDRLRRAGLRSQIMTQFTAKGTTYVLSLQSFEPPSPKPFSSEDHDYIELLGSLFKRQLELEVMESSLRDAEHQGLTHVQRLDALWRMVNNPNLRGPELVQGMLSAAASAMRFGQTFAATLGHVEDDAYVLDAISDNIKGSVFERDFIVGMRIALHDTLLAAELSLGRTQSWDDCQTLPNLPARARAAGLRSQIATHFVANGTAYILALGSVDPPPGAAFGPEDHEYVEVLASVFARQLEIDRAEKSLGAAEVRARQHAERLEALWRIANNPRHEGPALIREMLRHGADAMRRDQRFFGFLSRIEGNTGVVIAESTNSLDDTPGRPTHVGTRFDLEKTLIPFLGTTRTWNDLAALGNALPPMEASLGWRSLIATTFEAAGTRYSLGFGSPDPMREPFDAEDEGYLEVLASSFADRLKLDTLETSLRESEERSRQHAERLEALWQIINSTNLRDEHLVSAMLQQGAATIQPGQTFEAALLRIEGDNVIVEAVEGPPGTSPDGYHVKAGETIPLETTTIARVIAEGGGTRSWDDIQASGYSTTATRSRGSRSVLITTFAAAGVTWGLAFTSQRTTRGRPLSAQDRAYAEVLASFFANHLQQRWQFDRLQYQQSHDQLTGLLNRSSFRSEGRTAARSCEDYAVVMVNVDGLYEINESDSHMVGDAILVAVAAAIRHRSQPSEIVGLLGGDVFAIFIPSPGSPESVAARVREFSAVFERPLAVGERSVARSACIGVAVAPQDGTQFESILSRCDAALFTAKERGRGSTVFYLAGMEADVQQRAALHNELSAAAADDQFTLHYQPHIEIATGRVSGCEALIRWNHPVRGLLSPGHFIPFAEQTGLITTVDAWVMRNAFQAAAEFGALRRDFRLYFNLSGRQVSDPKLIREFTKAARRGIPLENLGVEVTETDAMRDVESTRRVLSALRKLNVRIAIDDFGTGYSSLSSLKRLPVDIVKIDRAFVSGVLTDPHDATIAETILSISGNFGFQTLAEGTERLEEIAWLKERGCDYAQGYAVCRPIPMAEFKDWLSEHDSRDA